LPATAAACIFAGGDITAAEPHRRARLGLGYVPQGREIFPRFTVYDTLRMGCTQQAGDDARDHRQGAGGMSPSHAPARKGRRRPCPAASSSSLAMRDVFAAKPRLVLLTSPTEGHPTLIIDEIVDTLQRLRERNGLTMILVEQNLDFIAALSQRILIIQKGAITSDVAAEDLLRSGPGRRIHRHHHVSAKHPKLKPPKSKLSKHKASGQSEQRRDQAYG